VQRKEITKILETWAEQIRETEDQLADLRSLLGAHPESPLVSAVLRLQRAYTDLVAERVGDNADWLNWYWQECRLGQGSCSVELDTPPVRRAIRSTDALAQLLLDCGGA